MGLFGKLFGKGTSRESVICPECGSPMYESCMEDRFECSNPNCNSPVSFRENGEIVNAFSPSRFENDYTCENCGQSVSNGDFFAPYEDGSNAQAYVICRRCQHKNIVWGFGDDD